MTNSAHSHDTAMTLSSLRKSDLVQVHMWKNDIHLARQLVASEQPISLDDVHDWFERSMKDTNQVLFGIYFPDGQTLIGIARLMFIEPVHKTTELGLYIGNVVSRGKGLGKATVKALIHHAFRILKMERIYLRVLASNQPAIHCYKACGFKQEGIWREHVLIDGKRQDMLLMGLLKSEYSEL